MKKYLSIFALLLAGFLTIAATAIMDDGDIVKKYMVIHHKDAKPDTIFIENIDSIDFGELTIHIPQIDSVKFSADNLTIEEGQTAALTYSVYEAEADQKCTITIADNSIADYKDGVVSAIAEGTTEIVATASDGIHADTCYVTVTKKPVIAVTDISLSLSELNLNVDSCCVLSATVSPLDATDKSITWTSTDEKVATVSDGGLVTAIAEGKASVIATASDGIIADTCYVTVSVPVSTDTLKGIKLTNYSKTLKVGEHENANIHAIPDEDFYYSLIKDVKYELSDPEVVSAQLYGLGTSDLFFYVKAVKPGTTTLKITVNGKFSVSKVYTVPQEVTNVTLSESTASIVKGDSIQLTATVEPETASDKTVTWTSSNTKVATVSAAGMVKGLDKGTATITAKAGDKTATCEVEVTNDTIHVESVTFASDSVSVDSAETINLTYTLTPARATVKAVTFSSGDETIATVSAAGEVAGKKVGQTFIVISSVDTPSVTDTCVVTVNYVPFHLEVPEPSSDSEYTATIPFKLKGDMSRVDSCGIVYSLNQDLTDSVRVYADFTSDKSEYSISLNSLKSHTTYFYYAFAMLNDSDSTVVYSDTNSVTTQAPDPFKAPAAGVDLGLPSGKLWSPYNMGAQQEADYGRLVSWGDIQGSSVPASQYAKISADFISGNESYDFAAKHWGDKWHMPTMTEWEELFRNTERTLVTMTDTDGVAEVTGWKFTGKNGNSIFLPCSGKSNGSSISENAETGYYWTGETNSWDESDIPTYAILESDTYGYGYSNGYLGYSIRPVYGDVSGKFDPYGTDDTDKTGETSNASRSVDLGIGIARWATCNIGAKESYDYGDYFAWGDVESKASYSQVGYKGYSADRSINQGYEDYGQNISGNSTYDAATANWGGAWRMPTDDELYYLSKSATWVWTTLNGTHGYRVYGINECVSHSIFLPAAGRYFESNSDGAETQGYYWSSTEYYNSSKPQYVAYAYFLNFDSDMHVRSDFYRYYGQSIRPVKTK